MKYVIKQKSPPVPDHFCCKSYIDKRWLSAAWLCIRPLSPCLSFLFFFFFSLSPLPPHYCWLKNRVNFLPHPQQAPEKKEEKLKGREYLLLLFLLILFSSSSSLSPASHIAQHEGGGKEKVRRAALTGASFGRNWLNKTLPNAGPLSHPSTAPLRSCSRVPREGGW